MTYDPAKISMSALMRPAFDAGIALTRLDERIVRSLVGAGWIERQNFADACASLWIDGELVHLEDLVLHDATRDIRTPTHELTIARGVLRTRRRISAQSPEWALSTDGIRTLRKTSEITSTDTDEAEAANFPLNAQIAPRIQASPKYRDLTPLEFLADRRNAIAHGRRTFENGANDLTLPDIAELASITLNFLPSAIFTIVVMALSTLWWGDVHPST